MTERLLLNADLLGRMKKLTNEAAHTDVIPEIRDMTPLERSVMLSTLDKARREIARIPTHDDVLQTTEDRVGALMLAALEETAPDYLEVLAARERRLEVKYDPLDLVRWLATGAWPTVREWLNAPKSAFRSSPNEPTAIPNDARVAIMGDWGTGMYGALEVASSIKKTTPRVQAVVHLGDVYYTGTERSTKKNFLEHWPTVPGAVGRACNSNHEMMGGGGPYFEMTLPRLRQSSSLWWLENENWTLLGLDTGYDDGVVGPMQATWLEEIAKNSAAMGRRVILFSHHQPWGTQNGKTQRRLVKSVKTLLASGNVFAWYWGHEHLCSAFEPHPKWGLYGACIGHSGYPYFRLNNLGRMQRNVNTDGSAWYSIAANGATPAGIVLDGPNKWIDGHEDEYGPHGYAVLTLGSESCKEVIYSAEGIELNSRVLG